MSAFYQQGLHVGQCTGQFMGQSNSDKKTPYFGLKFMILARVENDQEIDVQQSERSVYLYLSEAAIEMSMEVLNHLGFDKDSLRFLDPTRDGFFNFAGKRCDLWCKIEQWEGDTKEKWSVSLPRTPKEVTPIDDKELRRLDALFGKALKASRKPAAPAEAPEAPAAKAASKREPAMANSAPPPPPGDDIPF